MIFCKKMNIIKTIKVLGISSFTSLDGVSIAYMETDGVDISKMGCSYVVPLEEDVRRKVRASHELKPDTQENVEIISIAEEAITSFCAEIAKTFIKDEDVLPEVIGFAGHTTFHDPQNHYTHQIGSCPKMAELTGVKTVGKFRLSDVMAGGQGNPLSPIYYEALCAKMQKPLAVFDVGGTTDICWFGENGEMMAFVAAPGNSIINDWVEKKAGLDLDYNGKLAITGVVDEKILNQLMKHKYIAKMPPKSCDRNFFNDKMQHLDGMSLEDGAATATAFVAEAIAYSAALFLPEMPKKAIISGGGAKNPTLVRFVRQRMPNVEVQTATSLGWCADTIDAQAAAFWAARRINMMPISFPSTTGVHEPLVGGEVFEA